MTLFFIFGIFFFLSGRPSGRNTGRPNGILGIPTGTILGDFDRSTKPSDRSNKLLEPVDNKGVRTENERPDGFASGTIHQNVENFENSALFQKIQPNDTKKT